MTPDLPAASHSFLMAVVALALCAVGAALLTVGGKAFLAHFADLLALVLF